jgi:hypothetical protein
VPTYVAERYLPGITREKLLQATRRARRASTEMTAEGTPVRYLRSIFLPEDETSYCLFEASSREAVERANHRADVPFDRVMEAVDLDRGDAGSTPDGRAK